MNTNPTSIHVVRYDLIEGRQEAAQVIQAMNLAKNDRFYVWVTSKEEIKARAELENDGVKFITADSYLDLKNALQNVGQRFIVTASVDDSKLAAAVLNDHTTLNKAAVFDTPMKKEAPIEAVFAASFLVGARDETVLAIAGEEVTDALKTFLRFGGWAHYILKKPFEILSEIYKLIRTTEVSA